MDFLTKKSSDRILSRIATWFKYKSSVRKKLLGLKQNGADKSWAETAINILFKILEKHEGRVEELQKALLSSNQQSKCVTIPRPVDGLLQVAKRKDKPHFIFCGIWRWADLHSHHELASLETCQFPFDAEQTEVCVNPYHYKRIERPVLSPVFIPQYFNRNQGNYIIHSSTSLRYLGECETPPPPYSFSSEEICLENHDELDQFIAIPYEEPLSWATIAYYEFNCRVGLQFQCKTTVVTVVGSKNVNPNSEFSLGLLSNKNRNNKIDRVRNHIGNGIEFIYVGGKVYVKNNSNVAIFIQSRNYNLYNGNNLNAVCKLLPKISLCIFNYQYFAELLSESVYYGVDSVWELSKMCTIRISFMKGWGAGYLVQDIISTPCWLEIHLTAAYSWFDRIMMKMDSDGKKTKDRTG